MAGEVCGWTGPSHRAGVGDARAARAAADGPRFAAGLQLCATDIEAAGAALVEAGVEVTPVLRVGASGWAEGRGEDDWNSFLFFQDPDGNGWAVQEAPAPLAAR